MLQRLANVGATGETTYGPRQVDLSLIGGEIDWDAEPNRLIAGDLLGLDPDVSTKIEEAAGHTHVVTLANRLNLAPIVVVVGLLAKLASAGNRSAGRIAKAIFGSLPPGEIDDFISQRSRPTV
ncbi:MAG: hypothetical protein GY788_11570 [bacterium]|nr:hypothetical protein [bacterium]